MKGSFTFPFFEVFFSFKHVMNLLYLFFSKKDFSPDYFSLLFPLFNLSLSRTGATF